VTPPLEDPPAPPFPLPWPPLTLPEHKLALRPWGAHPGDAAALAEAWTDPEVARWTKVPEQHDQAAAARWIAGEEARRKAGQAIDLVIAEASDPSVIHGEVGLALVEQYRGWAELGYWLGPESRGEGRAAAATRLFVDWALRELPLKRIFVRVDPANPRSAAVAERAGLRHVGRLDDGPEVLVRDR
jgi:RimJ/RimL family protein N-acetyltransferase